ncbi:hypothetical protein JF546_02395 [Nitratireductor aquimarinus]|uniref:hypothetical protein n=1 Tax=Nitratireductor aquimarinus TaxID=889300 RepID=UPI001A8D2B88|nr:hypothetical protein [Nitratireductor aquimarinus]MBN8241858.1 hypothetical protein [Nitratireductor aquimarinus]MBY6130244.1 hypothetical protein [Nitratireductor aquimarinus]MCA1305127.1 hypothetical protein [Nitratireductor aquimarinus]
MIVEYDEAGRIFHVISDPVPEGLAELMRENGQAFLDLPPAPLPEVQKRDPDTGHLLFDGDGEPVIESPGLSFAECDLSTDYVVDGEIVRRPSSGCGVSATGRVVILTGLPEGSALSILLDPEDMSSMARVEAAGEFSFEVDEPGPVRICVTPPWPLLEEVFNVEIE